MTTMRDVAAIADVSVKTVSRVFNGDPHVTPETRARVEAVLRELNYVPNTLATAFRSGRAPVIGIAVPDIVDPFFAAIAQAIEAQAAASGMSVLVTSVGADPDREATVVEALLKHSLSGLVIAPITTDQSYLKPWTANTPIVFVDRAPTRLVADSFTEDDTGGAFDATSHIIGHGHSRIAFLGDTNEIPTTQGRIAGYEAALACHGIPVRDELVAMGVRDRRSAADAIAGLASLPTPPTAVFCSNARCTMAAIPALKPLGWAVVGFGDFPMADLLTPSITVVDQDPSALGSLAAGRILDRIDHPNRRYRRRTVLPVTLVTRDSCAAPAGSCAERRALGA
ncbi:LacI family DNA-binding transcriptional regulator [Tsukamurella soli]